ncbi:hypothetical protein IQ249_01670 [Lusitaniella coriacea LEGE 07157]|uniref:Uncharacterized protein n=1 Tax=Lusitaniella coriacea LEGE 07157 TaxID=945747 RepID=A0A8J7DNH3_9CYAN|nr:hypothetical protein [Lusitaniella coriacea]MBE9114594.1 hypothetical protein [Lusitaniella coriacea LEGE 07157]
MTVSIQPSHYEALLSEYSNCESAIALLKQYRPYLETIPSMRRPAESAISIPLPVVRLRNAKTQETTSIHSSGSSAAVRLPCDIAILMCDPDWKIKMGVEILIYIHRPGEDFSDLLLRWRQTQVYLDGDYEWLMSPRHQHILSEGSARFYPLFVVFPQTPERIQRGLTGASLPFVVKSVDLLLEEEEMAEFSSQGNELELGEPGMGDLEWS